MTQPVRTAVKAGEGVGLPKRMDARTQATRSLLISSGLQLLAEKGWRDATCRKVAQQAGVNHALVNYHFGGLDGLLDAVFDSCTARLRESVLPVLTQFEKRLAETPRKNLQKFMREFLPELFDVLAGKEARQFLDMLSGQHKGHTSAYKLLQHRVLVPLHQALTRFAAKARGIPFESLEAGVLGHLALTQVMAFFRGGYPVCRHMGWKHIPEGMEKVVDETVADAICRTVGLPAAMDETSAAPADHGEAASTTNFPS
jgi:AcrR family transcriptional regulator